MLRFLTAGESHGRGLLVIVEGMPAGVPLSEDAINEQLARRQRGYGRGGRMQIEQDRAEIYSGVMNGTTIGAPVGLAIGNKDWRTDEPPLTRPRPGHADLAGALKYHFDDVRRVLERSSARETVARVAAGALARVLLGQFGVTLFSHVVELGGIAAERRPSRVEDIPAIAEASPLRCADGGAEQRMIAAIDEAKARGDTLGGVFEVVALGLPVGLGTYVQWDRRLDGRLAQAMVSINAMKGVEIGHGFQEARLPGSAAHDEIFFEPGRGFFRRTNQSGGTEGGMTTGEPLVVRVAMKPLSTLRSPMASVDIVTKERVDAAVVRSDVTAVPAAGVIGEAMAALVLADAMLDKFGGDSLDQMRVAYDAHRQWVEHGPGVRA
ncbi:MAG TPA: chorismate synthase [bacterium]|nr:chorismate synthase [bacterium]